MTPLSTDERRALALLAALLLLASAARWLERPRSVLEDAPAADIAALEQASRDAKEQRTTATRSRSPARRSAGARETTADPHPAGYTPRHPVDPKTAESLEVAPIDLNTASAEQLQRIRGIGPAIAARLVARRDSLGRFNSYDDVDAISGIGPALLARIRAATTLR